MSHIVTIQTKVTDREAVHAACIRNQLSSPVQGKTRLYSDEVEGLLVQLPDWHYPVVVDLRSGNVQFDDFQGTWGNRVHLDRFLQSYSVEKTLIESRRRGLCVTEQALPDGSIKLQIAEPA